MNKNEQQPFDYITNVDMLINIFGKLGTFYEPHLLRGMIK